MSPDQARSVAIEQLKALGLSTYAARTFVGLISLGDGTAQDVSNVVDVPRTRVYDAAEELSDRGLVDVQQSNPKRFWVSSIETAGRHFQKRYSHRVTVLQDALESLEARNNSSEQRGVWTVTGQETVSERVVEFLASADEEIIYMTVGDLLTEEIIDSLQQAGENGVTIRLAEMSPEAEARIEQDVPGAESFESLWDWSDTPAGRLLMVDERKTLASVLVSQINGTPTPTREETAIWGVGEANNLVVVLRAMFTWELDATRE